MSTTLILVLLLLAGAILVSGNTFVPNFLNTPSAQVERIARAIATAEGYYVTGSLPQRYNNPGALKLSGNTITQFGTADEGWSALYRQVRIMLSGTSNLYSPSMTIRQVAVIYTGNDSPESWASNVASMLGVAPSTELRMA